jgi:hypothetical protein
VRRFRSGFGSGVVNLAAVDANLAVVDSTAAFGLMSGETWIALHAHVRHHYLR